MNLDLQTALEQAVQYPYALIRCWSGLSIGPSPRSIEPSYPDEWIEARFFGVDNRELRFFRTDGQLTAVLLSPLPTDTLLSKTYAIENPKFGAEITVIHVLAFDDDGQASIHRSILSSWKEAKTHDESTV